MQEKTQTVQRLVTEVLQSTQLTLRTKTQKREVLNWGVLIT